MALYSGRSTTRLYEVHRKNYIAGFFKIEMDEALARGPHPENITIYHEKLVGTKDGQNPKELWRWDFLWPVDVYASYVHFHDNPAYPLLWVGEYSAKWLGSTMPMPVNLAHNEGQASGFVINEFGAPVKGMKYIQSPIINGPFMRPANRMWTGPATRAISFVQQLVMPYAAINRCQQLDGWLCRVEYHELWGGKLKSIGIDATTANFDHFVKAGPVTDRSASQTTAVMVPDGAYGMNYDGQYNMVILSASLSNKWKQGTIMMMKSKDDAFYRFRLPIMRTVPPGALLNEYYLKLFGVTVVGPKCVITKPKVLCKKVGRRLLRDRRLLLRRAPPAEEALAHLPHAEPDRPHGVREDATD